MTIAEDFTPGAQTNEGTEYPVAFGITFSPKVIFILLVLVGVGGGGYLTSQQVLPAYKEYQALEKKKEETSAKLDQTKNSNALQKIAELQAQIADQKNRQPQILALLSNSKTVDTLLIDFNKIFQQEKVTLTTYNPVSGENGEPLVVVDDGSFGDLLNGKLQRRTINIGFEGTLTQTKSIIQRLERFQSLIVIKNFNATVSSPATFVFDQGQIKPQAEPKLSVTFVVDVVYPISEEELKKIAEAQAAKNAPPATPPQ
jgi:type IV pilus assembly protein PilO